MTETSKACIGSFAKKPYAIVPESMPTIAELDHWGRQDMLRRAETFPDNLGCALDAFLVKYCGSVPQLPCVSLSILEQ